MSEIRQNMATKEWVIIATERAKRPEDFANWATRPVLESLPPYESDCPFCVGNEEGPDMELLRMPAHGPWELRVVKNKFPALNIDGEWHRSFDGVNRWISGVGYHEVVIESPLHNTSFALQTSEPICLALQAFQMRGRTMAEDSRIEHIIYFKNHGPRAGTSLVHPHSQIIGLPVIPYDVRARIEEARRYFDDTGNCVYCVMMEDEIKRGERVVMENDGFVVFLPYAAFSPFHTWIMPKQHESDYLEVSRDLLQDLAQVLHRLVRKLYVGLNDPDFNFVLRSAPLKQRRSEHVHWYMTMIPRVTQSAGFELGSGMFINTALPEASAAFLRSIDV